jgi:glycosyltransferase involved in cell wall biosynthesis
MKIAVLMSTFNGEKYLDKQLKSLAEQTVIDDLTLYIRDDGSTDKTFKIIEKWKDKINIILLKECNAGPAISFWKLMMNPEINADYYVFCDQDDIWDRDKIEQGIKELTGEYQLYACNCRLIDENDKVIKDSRVSGIPNMDVQRLFVSGCTQGCSMIFTDALCKYIRRQKISCVPMHDIVLMLYAKYFGKIYWDTETHFSYRVHSNNVVAKNNKSFVRKMRTTWWNWNNSRKHSMATVAKEMLKNIESLPDNDRKFLYQISAYKTHRLQIIFSTNQFDLDHASLRSFIIRVLLGLY